MMNCYEFRINCPFKNDQKTLRSYVKGMTMTISLQLFHQTQGGWMHLKYNSSNQKRFQTKSQPHAIEQIHLQSC